MYFGCLTATLRLAARRLLWGRFVNTGQIGLSQNYVPIDKVLLPEFLSEMTVAMEELYLMVQRLLRTMVQLTNVKGGD